MKLLCFLYLLLTLWSCGEKTDYDQLPQALELVLIDSVEIIQSNGFLTKPSDATLINDTLIGVESFHSRGVWVFDIRSGKEVSSITNGQEKGINLLPTKVHWFEYPMVYVFEGTSKKIHQFNLSKELEVGQKHVNTISLAPPNDIRFKPLMLGLFSKDQDHFFIEHSTNQTTFTSNKFYNLTDKLIGKYDLKGNFIENSISFPHELREMNKFIAPGKIFTSGFTHHQEMMISFPFTESISIFQTDNLTKTLENISFPKSRHFIYDIPFLEFEVENIPGTLVHHPEPHYFSDFKVYEDGFVLQSFMKDQKSPQATNNMSHILKYNNIEKTWSETINSFKFLDFGHIAGIKNDTLYIVDAALVSKDNKYIKRAILKPIEE
ncbi:hypothetical protein LZF95_10750 [Algoriphagus sp. AGSA1]|uniref:hypothetical protein n=1 Tax=Algoriphagus sp. AGSA1 TaxID=2907213 RepID=UPI001F475DEA|nr:hypothetical protein [Algoriphagus sp. AGSA1]MCE7055154.1 hypothetical protein [Algoriphagus sp. AGSA1]